MGGPPAEFSALYDAELPYVFRTLRRLGVPPSDVEDVAHDVFVVAFRRRNDRDPERSLRGWLFGIAYRIVGNYRKKAHRNREVAADRDHGDTGRSPEEVAGDRELLLTAMESLDLGHRAAVILHDIEGLTGPAVAEALGIPINTAYSRVRNARQKLLERVRQLQGESQ